MFQEEDYYAEKGMHMNLSPLISGKMLTKKVAEQEAKRIRNLMAARDAFLRTHKAKLENLQRKAERAKTSIAGRQQQRRDLEVQEYKRLSAASQKKAENVLNQANRGELVRDMPSRKQGTELSFNSSYGLQPLNKMLNRQSSQKSLFSTKVQRYVSTHGDYEDDFHEQAMSRQSSSSGSLLMQEAPISAANSFVHDEHNGTMMSAVENNLHSKEKVVKGYMRVDAFNQLQELVKANRELTASVASMKACLDNTIKVRLISVLASRLIVINLYLVIAFRNTARGSNTMPRQQTASSKAWVVCSGLSCSMTSAPTSISTRLKPKSLDTCRSMSWARRSISCLVIRPRLVPSPNTSSPQ